LSSPTDPGDPSLPFQLPLPQPLPQPLPLPLPLHSLPLWGLAKITRLSVRVFLGF
jgi:hypothetical protein